MTSPLLGTDHTSFQGIIHVRSIQTTTIKCHGRYMEFYGYFYPIYSWLYKASFNMDFFRPYRFFLLNHILSQFFNIVYNSAISLNCFQSSETFLIFWVSHICNLSQVFKAGSTQQEELLWLHLDATMEEIPHNHFEFLKSVQQGKNQRHRVQERVCFLKYFWKSIACKQKSL